MSKRIISCLICKRPGTECFFQKGDKTYLRVYHRDTRKYCYVGQIQPLADMLRPSPKVPLDQKPSQLVNQQVPNRKLTQHDYQVAWEELSTKIKQICWRYRATSVDENKYKSAHKPS